MRTSPYSAPQWVALLPPVALRAAAEAGAREAFLDSSSAGLGIYRRLAFAEIGPVCWCECSQRAEPH